MHVNCFETHPLQGAGDLILREPEPQMAELLPGLTGQDVTLRADLTLVLPD